ncbi:MAG: aldo/keto reductase [Richelia sp. RM2_1_2]|nr:aldo/keto reductase [Richelia sp. SM1_7_0]NJN10451.1 aldo/keto reductase [Richelia sp. RM1_1_1]NJO62784.1 aldo/keto reductase [Richelia sp. RM2_1_2]
MKIQDNSLPPIAPSTTVGHTTNRVCDSDLPFYRKFGRTDLTVSCLGLGGGAGISSEDTLYAFDQGINYFFYSCDLHHYTYSSMSNALRQLCSRGSSVREKVVLATVTYIKNPEAVISALMDQFKELNIDYVDIFFWGWIGSTEGQVFNDCLQLSPFLRGTNTFYQKTMEEIFGASELMKKMGVVRYVGASFHDLNIAQQWLNSPLLDVVMIRNNATYRYAENLVLNKLSSQDPQRPGIVTFKSTSCSSGLLWEAPIDLPLECWRPQAPDLYRYNLSQNCVDVCLTGLTNRIEIDSAIAGVKQGKLTSEEIEYLKLYGNIYLNNLQSQDVASEKLIYRNS